MRITNATSGVEDWLLLASLLIYVTAEGLVIQCKQQRLPAPEVGDTARGGRS